MGPRAACALHTGLTADCTGLDIDEKGLLAATTPIGKALMGHGKGDVVEAKVPSGVMKFEILEITL